MKRNLLQIAAFALGTGAQAALGFVSVPLLVRLLGVEELGRWSVIEAMFQLGAQIALLGFNQTLIKYISGDGMAPWPILARVARKLVPAALLAALIVGICAKTIVGLTTAGSIAVAGLLFFECWLVLAFGTARAAPFPLVFSFALTARAGMVLIALSVALFAIPGFVVGASGIALMWAVVYLIVALFLGFVLLRKGSSGAPAIRADLKAGLRYGLPLLITVVLAQSLQYADRFMVSSTLGFQEAGHYLLHAKIANALAFAALPVQLWWPTARFEHLRDLDGGQAFFRRASLWGVAFFGVAAVVLAGGAPLLLRWFAPGVEFKPLLFLALLAGMYFQSSAVFFNVGLLQEGATQLNVVVWVCAAVVQIAAQVVLLASIGILGAALGAAMGAVCAFSLQYSLSQRILNVKYPVFRLAGMCVVAVGISFSLVRGFA